MSASISLLRLSWLYYIVCFGLSSLYLFRSGTPQVGDVLLIMWFFLVALHALSTKNFAVKSSFFACWTAFVIYAVIVSLVWTIVLSDNHPASYAPFYVYNWIFGACLLHLINSNRDLARYYLKNAVVAATVVSLFLLAINFNFSTSRQTGGFNNPNQLGYFSLLMICSTAILHRKEEHLGWRFWFVMVTSTMLLLFSYSLTAIGALFAAWGGAIIRHNLYSRLRAYGRSLPIFIVIMFAVMASEVGNYFNNSLEVRINRIESKTDNAFAARGYDRIYLYSENLFFGAGEGARERFPDSLITAEIHSTIATTLFSYGIFGLMSFTGILLCALWRKQMDSFLIVSAPLLYGLAHNGLRVTAFWMLLIIVFIYAERRLSSKRHLIRTEVRSPFRHN